MGPPHLARVAFALIAMAAAAASSARATDATLEGRELRGTVGAARVGGYVVIRDQTQFVRGHYFYASQLKDIPLSGQVDGENVTLQEPEGGVFHLRLFSNGSAGGQPLDFRNTVGLVGTWTRGSETLPVTLNFDFDAPVGERFYGAVTPEPDANFERRVARFLAAAVSGDRAAAAGMVSYPLRVNAAQVFSIGTRADLLSRWSEIFTPRYVALLRTAIPHEMFVHEGMAMVGDGAVWFDAKGAAALNIPH